MTTNADDSFRATLTLEVLRAGRTKPEAVPLADAYPDQATASYFNGRKLTSLVTGVDLGARTRAGDAVGRLHPCLPPRSCAKATS